MNSVFIGLTELELCRAVVDKRIRVEKLLEYVESCEGDLHAHIRQALGQALPRASVEPYCYVLEVSVEEQWLCPGCPGQILEEECAYIPLSNAIHIYQFEISDILRNYIINQESEWIDEIVNDTPVPLPTNFRLFLKGKYAIKQGINLEKKLCTLSEINERINSYLPPAVVPCIEIPGENKYEVSIKILKNPESDTTIEKTLDISPFLENASPLVLAEVLSQDTFKEFMCSAEAIINFMKDISTEGAEIYTLIEFLRRVQNTPGSWGAYFQKQQNDIETYILNIDPEKYFLVKKSMEKLKAL